ncbi:MAG: flagellar motor switch protein FliN [Deltaproteobacteria bacterium]|nr:flagellar motor switch protein FliN [Deltaproteobacteria bacterium]
MADNLQGNGVDKGTDKTLPPPADDQWGAALSEQKKASPPGLAPSPAVSIPHDAAKPAFFGQLKQDGGAAASNIDMILDIPVTISVELGRTKMFIKDLLALGQGAVVELEKLAGESIEILANGRLIARGEAVVVNDKFGVKLTDIVSPTERINKLK